MNIVKCVGRLVIETYTAGASLLLVIPDASAWTSEEDFVIASTNAIANKEFILNDSFGEELLEYAQMCSNAPSAQALSIVDSYRHICLFEETLADSNLVASIALSSNVMIQTSMTPDDWRFWASRLVLSGAQALFDDVAASYSTLTNTLLSGSLSDAQHAETNVIFRSLIDAFEMEDLSCHQAFRALSGVGASVLGLTDIATNLVFDLPAKYRQMIDEVINAE